jgi:hypothetical protein
MNWWQKILMGILAFIFLAIGGLYFFLPSSMCGNEILAEHLSPNKKLKAIVFKRDCGATTGFSTQITIQPSNNNLENEGGNVFSADTNHDDAPSSQTGELEIGINWLSDTRLAVQYHKLSRVFQSESTVSGVQIEYQTFQ